MKILYQKKVYEAIRDKDGKLFIEVNKKKVFVGYGENNLISGCEVARAEETA